MDERRAREQSDGVVELHVAKRESLGERCAVCHDAIAGASDVASCERCATTWHVGCREELGRCPTLGCEVAPPSIVVTVAERATPPARPSSSTALLLSFVSILVLAGATAAYGPWGFYPVALVHFVVAPLYWTLRLRGAWNVDVGLRSLVALVVFQGLIGILAFFAISIIVMGAFTVGIGALGYVGELLGPFLLVFLGGTIATAGPPLAAWTVGREPWQPTRVE